MSETKQPEADDLHHALCDALSGWRYIREHHGDLYGVGWDRVEQRLDAQITASADRLRAMHALGVSDPAAEIARLRKIEQNGCLKTICEAFGWQGGTIHQAVAEIKRLRAESKPLCPACDGLGYTVESVCCDRVANCDGPQCVGPVQVQVPCDECVSALIPGG